MVKFVKLVYAGIVLTEEKKKWNEENNNKIMMCNNKRMCWNKDATKWMEMHWTRGLYIYTYKYVMHSQTRAWDMDTIGRPQKE